MMTTEAQSLGHRGIMFAALLVITAIINVPIISMLLNSLKSTAEILSSSSLLPLQPTLDNFIYLSSRTNFPAFFRNSVIVAGGGTLLSVVAAALAGYALSRYRTRFTDAYGQMLLGVQMFPIILALIPLFIVFRGLGLINTYWAVILLYMVIQLPFATWMFRGFFDSIPRDLEEAAWVDGCTRLRALWHVVIPLAGPGTAAVVIFSFLFSYNEYLIANVFLRDQSVMTVPVGIQQFQQQYATEWGSIMAAATLAMLPTFILFLFVQRYMQYGAVSGAVKG
ncbi:MAG: carbohydrate ABC transporter permease [Chloroflexota bacterium]|nr:carbohydrate ABC transporter permease [Chloroflexota bacterium]